MTDRSLEFSPAFERPETKVDWSKPIALLGGVLCRLAFTYAEGTPEFPGRPRGVVLERADKRSRHVWWFTEDGLNDALGYCTNRRVDEVTHREAAD